MRTSFKSNSVAQVFNDQKHLFALRPRPGTSDRSLQFMCFYLWTFASLFDCPRSRNLRKVRGKRGNDRRSRRRFFIVIFHFHLLISFRTCSGEGVVNEGPQLRMVLFHPYDTAAVIARPPAPTPTIKWSPDCYACICTTTGRCCCPRGIEVILSRQSRAWALYRGRNREQCRRARGPTGPVRRRPRLSGGPLSSPGIYKCSPAAET